ncbi:type I restriction endonuclease [Pseudostreptobacillus hongkongensis]|uniref:type I restriction endonuclease n=1 Tax=Pseudostreptobacillus hongkongensis TaxID=1162717 RepID=UPI0009EA8B20
MKYGKVKPQNNKNLTIAEWPCIKENGKKGYADYALFVGLKLVGIIEAKKFEEDVLGALNNDATIYSKGINLPDGVILYKNVEEREYKVPFIFSSNGREYNKDLPEKSGILFKDLRDKKMPFKALKGFYSP